METSSETAPASSNPFNLFLNIWTSPTQAYVALQPRPRWWYPFLAVIGLQIGVAIYYFSSVDFGWMMEQSMAASGQEMSPEMREAMQNSSGGLGPTLATVFGSLAIVVMFSLIFAISALYYWLVSLFTADGNRYGQWFGFVCWSSTPMMFAALASVVSIALNENGQILQSDLNPLSLNSLIFNFNLGEPGYTFLSSVDLTMFWVWALNIIGYRVWTNKSTATSILVASIPYVLVLGIFAYFSFT